MARRSLKKNVEALAAAALMAAAYAGMRLVNAWLGREKKPQPPALFDPWEEQGAPDEDGPGNSGIE